MSPRAPQITVAGLMAIVATCAPVVATAASLRQKRIVESLHSLVAVRGWSRKGLLLTGGRAGSLPGLRALPVSSRALAEATKRGVELGSDDRVYALVRVHHWCGNDPVREHIA